MQGMSLIQHTFHILSRSADRPPAVAHFTDAGTRIQYLHPFCIFSLTHTHILAPHRTMSLLHLAQRLSVIWLPAYVVIGSLILWPVLLMIWQVPVLRRRWYAGQFTLISGILGIDVERRRDTFSFVMLQQQRKTESDHELKILEIGPGTGVNFQFYPRASRITTIESNAVLNKQAAAVRAAYPHLGFDYMLTGSGQDMNMIPDEAFDVVVTTHVLCCTPDPQQLLREVYRVLRKVWTCCLLLLLFSRTMMCFQTHMFPACNTTGRCVRV